MRIDWLPFSASSLVAGVTALAVGALLMPSAGDASNSLEVVRAEGARWLAVAGLYFVAAVGMTMGLPSILTLFSPRTAKIGLTAVAVFAIGCIGTAGYAMLLAFFRALVEAESITSPASLDELTSDAGLGVFLFGWIGAFYLGELLIAIALLRARSVPTWVPLLLIGHVALFPIAQVLPDRVSSLAVLLTTIAFAGIGITANNRDLIATT